LRVIVCQSLKSRLLCGSFEIMAKQDYINAIAHCDELKILPETPRGNFILFLIYWIKAGCKPVDVSQLQTVIGMRDDVWSRYKTSVISVADVIIPELRAIHKNRVNALEGKALWRKKEKIRKSINYTFTDSNTSQEQDKRPQKLSKSIQYLASHAPKPAEISHSGDIPAGFLRD